MRCVGEVAGSEDGRMAGAQAGVDQHPVVDGQTGRSGQLDVGDRPDADEHRVRLDPGAVGEHRDRALQPVEAGASAQVHALCTMYVGEPGGDVGTSAASSGSSAGSTTVTRVPSVRAVAATSMPIQPPPRINR